MRLHGYTPPVRAAAMYAIGTPEELAAASARANERLQADEHVDPLAAAYQGVMEAAGRRMAKSLRAQAISLTATGDVTEDIIARISLPAMSAAAFVPPDEDEVIDSERLAGEMAEGTADAVRGASRVVVAELNDEGITFDVDTVFTQELLDGIGAKATTLTEQALRDQYRLTLEVAADQGWSVAETADALTNKIDDLAPYRARALARTDLNGLANGGSLHVAQTALSTQEQPVYKQWLATDDELTRESHLEADGQTVAVHENFDVGGWPLPYPGYPFAPAEEVINCRCTITYTTDPSGGEAVLRDPNQPSAQVDPLAHVAPSDELLRAVSHDWERSNLQESYPGQSLEDLQRQVEAKLKAELAAPDVKVRIRTPSDVAVAVGEDGRFLSQFESRTSGGAFGPEMRKSSEQQLFSLPRDLPHEERPIYGYLSGVTEDPGAVRQYGNTVWQLKDSARVRTTWTADDSLALEFAPSPVDRPSFASVNPARYAFGTPDPLATPLREFDTMYIEAQVHGGVTLADVDWVEFQYSADKQYLEADAERLRAALRAKGYTDIEVRVVPGAAAFGASGSLEQGLGLGDDGLEVDVVGGVGPVPASDDAEGGHLGADERGILVEHPHLGALEAVPATLDEEHEGAVATLTDDLHMTDDTSAGGGSQPSDPLRFAVDDEEAPMSTTVTTNNTNTSDVVIAAGDGEVELVSPIAWDAVLAVEGEPTEDGRLLERGSIGWRDLPLTLMGMLVTSAWGHEGAEVAGRIDSISRVINDLASSGELTSEFGVNKLAPLIADRTVRGVSVDLAVLDYEYRDRNTGAVLTEEDLFDYWIDGRESEILFAVLDGTIVGATVCPMPAIANAEIALAASAGLSSEGRAILAAALDGRHELLGDVPIITMFTPFDRVAPELIASAPLVELAAPARSHFEVSEFPGNTPLTITEPDSTGWRRVFGHIATWDTCHVGIPGVCTTAPRSSTSPPYALFHQGQFETDEGLIDVGKLMLGTGHASLGASRMEATKHYDKPDMVGAYVRAHDGEHGIWVSGVVRPELTEAGLREFRANPPSGDWRSYNGYLELIAVCAVAVPGFPVVASADANITASAGEVTISALIASAGRITPTDAVKQAMLAAGCACDDVATSDEQLDDLAELALT